MLIQTGRSTHTTTSTKSITIVSSYQRYAVLLQSAALHGQTIFTPSTTIDYRPSTTIVVHVCFIVVCGQMPEAEST